MYIYIYIYNICIICVYIYIYTLYTIMKTLPHVCGYLEGLSAKELHTNLLLSLRSHIDLTMSFMGIIY